MSENDQIIAEFQNITGVDSERAKFYLESANWQLDLAMANFYEGDPDVEMSSGPPTEVAAASSGTAGEAQGQSSDPKELPKGKINLMEDSDSEEEGQAFYAGGSTSSGQQIVGPGKKKRDIVEDMFKAAKEAGAEAVDKHDREKKSKQKAFTGGGFRLGCDETSSQSVRGEETEAEPRTFILKMWKEGFSINDGELRAYDDPANKEFLASVMRGTIPIELVREAKGGEVHVDMEDHRQEEYVRPKVNVRPFQGAGNVLGSIAPAVSAPAAASSDPAKDEEAARSSVKVDDSQPTTSIQVRLADGSRLIVKLNHSHTVADLRNYIVIARPQYASSVFALLTTFPNKELTEEGQTLKDAGLLGAAILQRLK